MASRSTHLAWSHHFNPPLMPSRLLIPLFEPFEASVNAARHFFTPALPSPHTQHTHKPQKAKGAAVVSSPKAVAEQADVVFVIVGYPADVEAVVLGPEGVLAGLKPEGVLVDW